MDVPHSIFTLDGGSIVLGSFWYACDSDNIKSCIRMGQIWFLAISKNNHDVTLDIHLYDYFIEMPKNLICHFLTQLLMVPPCRLDQKMPKTIEPPIWSEYWVS